MRVPDEQLITLLKGVQADPKFNFIVEWLHDSLNDAREANDTLEGRELHLSQGEIACIKQILQAIEESGHAYERVVRSRERAKRTSEVGSAIF